MIKRIVLVIILVLAVFGLSFGIHSNLLNSELSFSLFNVYIFHVISVVIIYTIVEIVAEKLPSQAGYSYLMLVFFKIGAFVLIFQSSVFENDALTQTERFALVIPLFLFLIAEAAVVAKLLNSK
ncbi:MULTISPECIES: DUF6168 family protein [Bizionia]|uniref:Uncharacterized protein n=1 Tax=Bizionia algoritergicola TaxID=291187 RepID=A0A5D0R3A4_9FLAO|nr:MULTISPECIES: DUF6168 family protein [Bizionia]TYB75044.1 hypothetical protein ES675_02610 [Bizionia algoritergicola]